MLVEENRFSKKFDNKNVTICLSMIVCNENTRLLRVFESAKQIIDMICITDTQSDDNTIEVIRTWCNDNKIPYAVYSTAFVDFAVTRTEGINNSINHFHPTYLLLLDGDFRLKVLPNFRKNLLTEKKYSMVQKQGNIEYDNTRLIRTGTPWKYFTPTHEYLGVEDDLYLPSVKLESIYIEDIADGGCKENKLQRDMYLLSNYMLTSTVDDPIHLRCIFYLAQTLRDMRMYDESCKYYLKRATMKHRWPEETYYSYLQAGGCMEKKYYDINKIIHGRNKRARNEKLNSEEMNRITFCNMNNEELIKTREIVLLLAFTYYLRAYEVRRHRAESLYLLVRLASITNNTLFGFDMCNILIDIKPPTKEVLFLDVNCHKKNELTLLQFAPKLDKKDTRRISICLDAAETVVASDEFTDEEKDTARKLVSGFL